MRLSSDSTKSSSIIWRRLQHSATSLGRGSDGNCLTSSSTSISPWAPRQLTGGALQTGQDVLPLQLHRKLSKQASCRACALQSQKYSISQRSVSASKQIAHLSVIVCSSCVLKQTVKVAKCITWAKMATETEMSVFSSVLRAVRLRRYSLDGKRVATKCQRSLNKPRYW